MLSKKIVLLSLLSLLLNACADNKNHDDLYSEFCNYYLNEHPEQREQSEYTINSKNGLIGKTFDNTEFVAYFENISIAKIDKSDLDLFKRNEESEKWVNYYGYTQKAYSYFVSFPYSGCNVIQISLDNQDKQVIHYYSASEDDIDFLVNYCTNFLN